MKFFQLRTVLNPFLSLRSMPRTPLELPAAAKRWYHLRRKKCLGVAAHQVTMSCVDIRIFVCIFSNEKKQHQLRHECSMQQINIENIQHVGKWIFRKMAKSTLAFYKRCRMDLLKSRTTLCNFQTLLRYEDDSCMPFLKGARF